MTNQPSLFGNDLVSYRTASGKVVEVVNRGKHYVEPRGYADKPGTGPAGETCGSCKFCMVGYRRRFKKCELNKAAWTHTRRTDILTGAAACAKWEKPA